MFDVITAKLMKYQPMVEKMHPDIRQTGLYPDDLAMANHRPMTGDVARASLGAAKLPPTPQPVEMANTDVKGRMSPGDLVKEEGHTARRQGSSQSIQKERMRGWVERRPRLHVCLQSVCKFAPYSRGDIYCQYALGIHREIHLAICQIGAGQCYVRPGKVSIELNGSLREFQGLAGILSP